MRRAPRVLKVKAMMIGMKRSPDGFISEARSVLKREES